MNLSPGIWRAWLVGVATPPREEDRPVAAGRGEANPWERSHPARYIMRKPIPALLSVLLALVAGAVALVSVGSANAAITGFVQRCGIHFCLNGKTYYFAGANTYD